MLMNAASSAIYGSSYFAAHAELPLPRASLVHDLDVDVCVIGAGLAGLTTAREIARRGWSVVVLEGQRIAWNASGRNTGFVLPGFGQDAAVIRERVGFKRTRALWALRTRVTIMCGKPPPKSEMQGLGLTEGWLHVSKTDRAADIVVEAEFLRELGADVEFWPADLVRSKLKTARYFQAIHYPAAFNIHPLNYALGLARLAEQAGARIFEETAALSIDPAGVRKRVVTPNGRVRAAHIVLAGNVHLGALMPEIARTLLPIRTYVVATEKLGDRLAEAIDYRGSVSDTDWADNHYRIVERPADLVRPHDDLGCRPRRFAKRLRRDIRRVYPQLGGVEIEYAWTGTLGNAVHRMPQIGELAPGVWIASGFGGHGINTTAMGGNLIARAIVESDVTWRLFLPFELVWVGGTLGRAAMQAGYWIYRAQERVERGACRAGASRRRCARQRRKRARAKYSPRPKRTLPVPRQHLSLRQPSKTRKRKRRKTLAPERSPSAAVSSRHESEPLEQVHVLLVLEQRAMQGRNQLLRIALAQDFRPDILDHQELEPVEQLGG